MKRILFVLTFLASIVFSVFAADKKPPQSGEKAPLFEGKDQDGKDWKLQDRIGKKVVLLYFYPKDNTPGCTAQACGLRDQMGDLQKEDVEVVGVSFDSAETHLKFREQHKLNFTLLADTEGKIIDLYAVRRAPGIPIAKRVSFLIGKDGVIKHVTDVPAATTHLTEMKEQVSKLKK